jgi:hypothetical protein
MRSVVEGLCEFSGRGACTDAERRAALWLHDELRSRVHSAWVETRWLRPQRHAALALGCLLAVAGSLLATAAPIPGLAVAAAGALSIALESAGLTGPIRVLFPRRATQHVLTDVVGADRVASATERGPSGDGTGGDDPAAGPALVIAAAYDAPRRGLLLNDRWRRRLRRAPPGALAACALSVVAAAGARVGGVEGVAIGAVQLVPTLVLLVATAAAADIALSDWAPGANDGASGVAVALALYDELAREPPRALAPTLLLVGAGHAGPAALRSHLRAEGLTAERAIVLELGPCGAGRPGWRARHPRVEAAAERAADALGPADAARRPDRPVARLPGVRIACLDARGLTPRAHQEDDTEVDQAAMEAALDLALAIVDALDGELASGGEPAPSRPA